MARTARTLNTPLALIVACFALLLFAAAAQAQQPIEGLGSGQSRLTTTGSDGDPAIDSTNPSIAYDPTRRQYLMVWEQPVPSTVRFEIFGQLLDAAGHPIATPKQLTEVGAVDATLRAFDPEVVYSPDTDRFIFAFEAEITGGDREIFARLVNPTAADPEGMAVQMSDMDPATGSGFAQDPALAINTDSSLTDAQRVRFAWQGNGVGNADNAEIYTRRTSLDLTSLNSQFAVSTSVNDSAGQPAITHVPGQGYAFAWSADETGTSDFEIFAGLFSVSASPLQGPAVISTSGVGQDAFAPEIAGRPGDLLVAFTKDALRPATAVTRRQVFVQPLSDTTLAEGSAEAQVSNVFEGVIGQLALAYESAQDRYLVTFAGAAVSGKNEIYAQPLSASGGELATDDHRISLTPPSDNDNGDAGIPAIAADSSNRRWMAVWNADSLVAPLTDNEFELYGRLVGENFDRDNDGFAVNGSPADCNDADPAVNPSASEIVDNGVDENCDGVAAVTPPLPPPPPPPGDRDADGITDDKDKCPDLKRGDADRDNDGCPGPFSRLRTTVTMTASLRSGVFRIKTLRVTVPSKSKVVVSCKKGCKRKKQTLSSKTLSFKRFVKNLRVKRGAVIEVRATRKNFNGTFVSYTFTRTSFKKRELCIPYGKTKPVKRCP